MRFNAALFGAELKEEKSIESDLQSVNDNFVPLFRDPEEYSALSEEEKEELTKTMMDKYKSWSEKPFGS